MELIIPERYVEREAGNCCGSMTMTDSLNDGYSQRPPSDNPAKCQLDSKRGMRIWTLVLTKKEPRRQ